MKCVMFTGQGAQYKGMGKDLFRLFPKKTNRASEILGYDIAELCMFDKERKLGQTQFTQPALYVVNAFNFYENKPRKVDYYVGHSLGEYNALLAANAFDFETGLKLVQKRGELMAAASGGGMAAVLGVTIEQVVQHLSKEGFGGIDIANYNTPSQTVISGTKEDIKRVVDSFKKYDIKCIPLFVSAPFHSRYMKSASLEFINYLEGFSFSELDVPVIANNTAKPYVFKSIKETLSDQICNSVKWTESIGLLLDNGVTEFEEIGGGILTKMVTEIRRAHVISDKSIEVTEKEIIVEPIKVQQNESNKNELTCKTLGSKEFRNEYGLDYAYVAGAMYRGIASKELVIKMAKANMLSFFGTGGLTISEIQENITAIKYALSNEPYGMNLLCNIEVPSSEMETVELFLKEGIKFVEAAAFMQITPALAYFHIKGLKKNGTGIISEHKILAKVSRPEVAEAFMNPVPERLVKRLLDAGEITEEQAELAKHVPVSRAICVEADSGGHTDRGVSTVIFPSIETLRNTIQKQHNYKQNIFIGLAGGIGTPGAAAAAFIMGADFILTGSINQCTVEAGISNEVKNLLQEIDVQDTEYAPAGDMFEIGATVQVLKKGTLFAARANKLYSLYQQYDQIEEIPEKILTRLEKTYFNKEIKIIWEEVKSYKRNNGKSHEIVEAEGNGKKKMAMIFKWYFAFTMKSSFSGDLKNKINFQVHTGPALGAFNQWVLGTEYTDWRARNVDRIGITLLEETASTINNFFSRK